MSSGLSGVLVVASYREGPLMMRYLRIEGAILGAEDLCVQPSPPESYCERSRLQSRPGLRIFNNNFRSANRDCTYFSACRSPIARTSQVRSRR